MTDTAAPHVDQVGEGFRLAKHKEGLELLKKAGITEDRVPPAFDGAVLVKDIERLQLRSHIVRVAEKSQATSAQREAAGLIFRRAKPLLSALRTAGDVVASSLADKDGPLPLQSLIEQLERLIAAKSLAEAKLGGLSKATPTNAPAPMPREDGTTYHDELLGHRLPALYERLFSRKPTFAPTQPWGGGLTQHTECVRFITVVASRCLERVVSPSAVIEARKRFRTTLRKQNCQSVPAKNAPPLVRRRKQ